MIDKQMIEFVKANWYMFEAWSEDSGYLRPILDEVETIKDEHDHYSDGYDQGEMDGRMKGYDEGWEMRQSWIRDIAKAFNDGDIEYARVIAQEASRDS